jgi:hypothetical protein
MTEEYDFSSYSAQELAIASLYGFKGEGNTPLEELDALKYKIRDYVKTRPEKFRNEFRTFAGSELERTVDPGEKVSSGEDDSLDGTFI